MRAARGEPPLAFRYHDKGSLAVIGRGAGVAVFPNSMWSGTRLLASASAFIVSPDVVGIGYGINIPTRDGTWGRLRRSCR